MRLPFDPPIRLLVHYQTLYPDTPPQWLVAPSERDMWAAGHAGSPDLFTVFDVESEAQACFSRQSAKAKKTILNRPLPRWARYVAGVALLSDVNGGIEAVICGDEAAGVRYEYALGVVFAALLYEMQGLEVDERVLLDLVERVRREYVETA
ncbi:MAG: hypothetical protein IAE80_06955 [Anaerolinea sp.]|nr:hypothetical protein [Anaerolinea sp.]